MATKEEIVKGITQSFTGNGDYYFEYIDPKDCIGVMQDYSDQQNIELQKQRDELLVFIEELNKIDSVTFKKWYLFDKIREKAQELIKKYKP